MAILSDPQVRQPCTLKTNVSCFIKRLVCDVFQRGPQKLSDAEVMSLVASCKILNYKLEAVLQSPERGVAIRREMLSLKLPVTSALASLPYKGYDYSKVLASGQAVNFSSFLFQNIFFPSHLNTMLKLLQSVHHFVSLTCR